MVKARRGFSAGHWNLPGGFVDYGEHPAEAVVREAREEIGVAVTLHDLLGTYVSGFPGKPSHTLGLVWRGELASEGFAFKADEIETARFWRLDTALTLTRNPFARWAIVDHFRSLSARAAPLPAFTHRPVRRWRGPPRAVLLLDRDGVINRSRPGYVKRPEEFEFLPGALRALRALTDMGWPMAIVSNQDVMAWKIIGHEGLRAIHRRMFERFREEGVAVDNLYYCPHPPTAGCRCRKPKPGLPLAASRDLGADPTRSWMVGDKPSDIAAGHALGLRTVFLGSPERLRRFGAELGRDPPTAVAPSLRVAVKRFRRP
jgi:D-glycero-D-manno-heptose 1,7-bisphosphate phosphatase